MIGRQRLFAKHVLAGGQQRQRGRHMHAIGRAVDGGVELAPGERGIEPVEGAGNAVCPAKALARPGTASTQAEILHSGIAANSAMW